MSSTKRTLAKPLPANGIRLDTPTTMLPLARPLRRGAQRVMRTATVKYRSTEIRADYPELDHRDQSLLLALLSFAADRGTVEDAASDDGLEAKGRVMDWPVVDITVSVDELVKRAGWTEHHAQRDTYKALDRTLVRLHQVVLTGTHKDPETGRAVERYRTNLIFSSHDKEGGELRVRLCARLAVALTGAHYVNYLLSERSALTTPSAQILHLWLTGWCRQHGRAMRISLNALAGRLWPEAENPSRKQRTTLRQALREIGKLDGWEVRIRKASRDKPETATIKRA